jgi:aminoglycoside phosphotransferase (APT) family kinase protein
VTNGGREQRVSDVAVVHGRHVLVVNGPDGPRLPRLDDGFPSVADVFAAAGVPPETAVVAAPTRQVDGTPAHILHLVAVEHRPPGTDWLPLERLDAPAGVRDAIALGTDEWAGRTPRPANRPAWYAPVWSAEVDEWIDEQLTRLGRRRAGPSEPVKIWSLSAVLRIPTRTADDAAAGPIFFKAACDWFRAEPAITQTIAEIAPIAMPGVLAVDHTRAWMLMDPLPGDGVEPPSAVAVPAATALGRLQVSLVDHLPTLRAAGLPDRTLQPTCAGLTAVVEDSIELDQLTADERVAAKEMLPWLVGRVEAFADIGPPYSVAHGDLHLGNVAADDTRLTLYDWTDAAVSFPFLDAAHLAASTHSDTDVGPRVLAAYADVWSEAYERAKVERMLEHAALVNRAYQMVSYEGIYRSREPDSLWEMRGIVALSLRQLIEQWRAAGT